MHVPYRSEARSYFILYLMQAERRVNEKRKESERNEIRKYSDDYPKRGYERHYPCKAYSSSATGSMTTGNELVDEVKNVFDIQEVHRTRHCGTTGSYRRIHYLLV